MRGEENGNGMIIIVYNIILRYVYTFYYYIVYCYCSSIELFRLLFQMNKDTGKWNWARFKELSDLMENELLMNESKILQTHCIDGDYDI